VSPPIGSPSNLPGRQRFKVRQLETGVGQPFGDVRPVQAVNDPSFEAVDLIEERPPSHFECSVLIWVHGRGRYRPSVTQRDAPTAPGGQAYLRSAPGWVNTEP
jgi:hypothetical protein